MNNSCFASIKIINIQQLNKRSIKIQKKQIANNSKIIIRCHTSLKNCLEHLGRNSVFAHDARVPIWLNRHEVTLI